MEGVGARVLVVDDESAIRDLLDFALARAGFAVRSVGDGAALLREIDAWRPDAIVLDVMLPDVDGFTLLPSVRERTDAPIIMLTAKTETAEKVTGLTRGADDYVGKPFELDELIARIGSALRRPRLGVRRHYRYADLVVDLERRMVARGSRQIALSAREFNLLLAFVQCPERVFSRGELLDLVWGERDVVPNTLETYISYLRAKLDSNEPVTLIQTLRGAGYALRATPR